MHTQGSRDAQQGRDAGVHQAGLDVLVGLAPELRGEENGLLGSVLTDPDHTDAVADGLAFTEEPGVVIGQVGHLLHAGPTMIISQPGIPGIL